MHSLPSPLPRSVAILQQEPVKDYNWALEDLVVEARS